MRAIPFIIREFFFIFTADGEFKKEKCVFLFIQSNTQDTYTAAKSCDIYIEIRNRFKTEK